MVKKIENPEQEWRLKYRQLLEKHTKVEELHEKQLTHLKKTISKLCCAVDGLVPDIDSYLKQVRQLVTEPMDPQDTQICAKVENVAENIVGAMVYVDEQRGSSFQQLAKIAQHTLENLLALGAKGKLKDKINQLLKDFKKQTGSDFHLMEEVIVVVADMLNNMTASPEQDSRREKNILSKLFSKEDSPEHSAMLPVNPSQLLIPVEITYELQRMLIQAKTDVNAAQIDILLEKVDGLSDWEQLPALLDEISGLIVELKGIDKQKFEEFLQQLAGRLEAIQGFLMDSEKSQLGTYQDSETLDKQVRVQVTDLKSAMREATSLEGLQLAITQNFDAILHALDQFHTKQHQYKEKSLQSINLLKEKLERAESESNALKVLLKSQREQVMRDPLTQLYNRYGFHERSRHEYLRWKRDPQPLSFIMIDIDFFKRINDSLGHLAGDEALRQVAACLSESIRETDFLARFGGEEFVMILPNTRLGDAARVVNKIRQNIMNLPIKFEDKTFSVTVSAGVANFTDNDSPSDVLSRADSALYRAKQLGRNQVCCEMVSSKR